MDNLILKGLTEVDGMKFNHIEGGFGEDKKSMLVKDIADIHGRELREINERINLNRKRFKDSVDIIDLRNSEFAIGLTDSGIYTQNSINASKNIYLLSERGYSKLLKILEDDFAWGQYEKLVDGYFSMRETQNNLADLSPQLQLLINMELKQSQLEVAVTENKQEITEAKQNIQNLKDVITINPKAEWRKETNKILNSIGNKKNDYSSPKNEAYEALAERGRCRPKVLINNLKGRASLNGMAKSKVDNLGILDVLENDPRLREIYITIIKEMAIKYL